MLQRTVLANNDSPPLLAAERLRIDVAGAPVVEGLDVTLRGAHGLVLGAPRALLEAAAGFRPLLAGSLKIDGVSAEEALRCGRAGLAMFDAPVPPDWTTQEYVVWGARLSGRSRQDALVRATGALHDLMLDAHAETKVAALTVAGKRAACVAAALATGAPVLLLDDPVRGLPDDIGRALARVLARALESVRWVVFADEMSLSSPISLEADDAVIVHRGRALAHGPPAAIATEWGTYSVVVFGDVARFAREVTERGAKVLWQAGAELALELGPVLRTRDLLALGLRIDTTVLELSPLGSALRA